MMTGMDSISLSRSAMSYEIHVSLVHLLVGLVLSALYGWILSRTYVRHGSSMSNRRQFAKNFAVLAMTTMLIISIIKSSIALSLGLVGALSIVRFRAAIKEPEELTYLFLTIAVGLGCGAGLLVVTSVAFFAIVGIITLAARLRKGRPSLMESASINVSIRKGDGDDVLDGVVAALRDNCEALTLTRFDETEDRAEGTFLVEFKDFEQLGAGRKAIWAVEGVTDVAFIDGRDLA